MSDGQKLEVYDARVLSATLKQGPVNVKPFQPVDVNAKDHSSGAVDLATDVNTLRFFYNLGIDYLRQCVRLPPPNLLTPPNVLTVNPVQRLTSPNVHLVPRPPSKANSHSPTAQGLVSTPWTPPRASCVSGPDSQCQKKFTPAASDDETRIQSPTCQLQPNTLAANRSRPTQNVTPFQRRFSEPANRAISSSDAMNKAIGERDFPNDNDDEEEILKGQRSREFEDYCDLQKVKPATSDPEISSLSNTTTGRASQDSGWTSDVSSTGDVSPTTGRSQYDVYRDTAESPDHLSVFLNKDSDVLSTDDVKQVNEAHEYSTDNCLQTEQRGETSREATGDTYNANSAVDRSTKSSSAHPQPRPMKEIPVRFRKLLEAENERVANLCKRLQGLPLIGHSQPSLIGCGTAVAGGQTPANAGLYDGGDVKDRRSFECQKLVANDQQSPSPVLQQQQQQAGYLPPHAFDVPYPSYVPISYGQELVCGQAGHVVAWQSPPFSQGSYRWPEQTSYQAVPVSAPQSEVHTPVNSTVAYYQNDLSRCATLPGYPAHTGASEEHIHHHSSLDVSPAPFDKPTHHGLPSGCDSEPAVNDVCSYYAACYQPAYLPCVEVAPYCQLQLP